MTTETFAFQAEINQLMSLIINTFYSNKDIFLRELISNASDAIDKIRYQSLGKPELIANEPEFFIKLIPNSTNNTLTIYDSGIGMTKDDLINNLGTIAKSGTRSFMEAIQSNNNTPNMIGQFGVGFYSAFLVADTVEVITKHNDDQQYTWRSNAGGSFTISTASEDDELIPRGTKIVLNIKKDLTEYLSDERIKKLIKKHSEFISYPIQLYTLIDDKEEEETKEEEAKEEEVTEETKEEEVAEETKEEEEAKEEVTEENKEETKEEVTDEIDKLKLPKKKIQWETLNINKPLWTKSSKDITHDEYAKFYKSLYNEWEDHLAVKHFNVEGSVEFTGLIFLPKRSPFNMFNEEKKPRNMKLYVKKVFIMDDCDEIIPEWLNFVKGLVDSEDLPLNISREILQHNRIMKTINKNMVKKSLEMFEELTEDKEKYKTFYSNFSKNLKYGLYEDSNNRERITSLLRFDSTFGENRSFDDYINSMKEGQKDIYYISGESKQAVENSPFLEVLRKKGLEVFYFVEAIDEYMAIQLKEYKNKNILSITKEDLVLPETDQEKNEREENAKKFEVLCKKMKDILQNNVEKVQLSSRISDSACVLVTPSFGLTANMERISKAQTMNGSQNPFAITKKILEINVNNPIIKKLKNLLDNNSEDKTIKDLTWLLYEITLLTSGFSLENPTNFANRINKMIHLGLSIDEQNNILDTTTSLNNSVQTNECCDHDSCKINDIEELCESTMDEID